MSQLPFTFDANTVTPQGDRTPVPAGTYHVILKSSDVKQTDDKTGTYLQCSWEITEGPHKSRLVMTNLNLSNKNETATRIGHERLSALCHVVGRMQIQDSAQLHGLPHQIKVSVTANNKYNEVTGFLTADGRSAGEIRNGAPAPAGATQQAPAFVTQQAAPAAAFPPVGWLVHPQSPGYYYKGQEVKSEAELRAMVSTPPAVAAPAPVPAPTPQPAPAPAPAATYTPPAAPAQAVPPVGMPAAPAGLPAWMTQQAAPPTAPTA